MVMVSNEKVDMVVYVEVMVVKELMIQVVRLEQTEQVEQVHLL